MDIHNSLVLVRWKSVEEIMNERVLLQMLHVELCLEILTIFSACSPGPGSENYISNK